MAVNVPNRGYLPNVAEGAIVEVGAEVDGDGIHPESMPPVVEPIAGHIATQVALQDLIVNAPPSPVTASWRCAPSIEDPASPPDRRRAARCSTNSPRCRPNTCRSEHEPEPLIVHLPRRAASDAQVPQTVPIGVQAADHRDGARRAQSG